MNISLFRTAYEISNDLIQEIKMKTILKSFLSKKINFSELWALSSAYFKCSDNALNCFISENYNYTDFNNRINKELFVVGFLDKAGNSALFDSPFAYTCTELGNLYLKIKKA